MKIKGPGQRIKSFFKILGPGLITGAADDDPSGIATYSQTGANFGYSQLWTAIFMLPLMVVIQEIAGRIGLVTGKGIAGVIKKYYTKKILYFAVLLLLIANIVNIGADIGAMAESAHLFIPINFAFLTLLFTFLILFLEIFTSYKTYSKILKWLTISLLSYIVTAFFVSQNWGTVLKSTFIPSIQINTTFIITIVGVLGTTISPYMFFWEASEEVEEEVEHGLLKTIGSAIPRIYQTNIRHFRTDNLLGMLFSEIVTWFIIVTAAGSLHKNGITNINSAAQAAKALEPLVHTFPNAGLISEVLFALGIIGTGLLAVPILAGSVSYALSETMGWKNGLFMKFKQAEGFYLVIIIATIFGLAINLVGIDPIKALFYSAILNGIIAVPLIFVMLIISNNKEIMGKYVNGIVTNIFGWITFAVMALAIVVTLWTLF